MAVLSGPRLFCSSCIFILAVLARLSALFKRKSKAAETDTRPVLPQFSPKHLPL